MKIFGFFNLGEPWTFAHWARVLNSISFEDSLYATIIFGFSTATVGTLFFAVLAWLTLHQSANIRKFVFLSSWLPWVFPGIILGVTVLQLTLELTWLHALRATIIPMLLVMLIKELPISFHLIYLAMSQTHKHKLEAAYLSGASRHKVFLNIALPLAAPALAVVFLMIFSGAIKEISSILLIAPPDFSTLSLLLFEYSSIHEFESASVVGTILAFLSLIVAIFAYIITKRIGYFS